MKKLSSLSALVILVMLSLLFSCQKGNLPNNEKKSKEKVSALSADDCERLNFEELNIGDLHNQYVIAAYEHVDFSNPESVPGQLNEYFDNIEFDVSALDVTREEFNALLHQYNDQLAACGFEIRGCENNVLNEETFSFIRQILEEGENMTGHEDYYATLDQIQEDANNRLTCGDLDAVTGTIIIAKKISVVVGA